MGHCISVYLIKSSELRDEKISNILDNKDTSKIIWTELKQGILATTDIPNKMRFTKDKEYAYITTDYFGGSGHQTARYFVNNKKVQYDSDEILLSKVSPINNILQIMGVVREEGMDEFDTIGLGNYRTNGDFNTILNNDERRINKK